MIPKHSQNPDTAKEFLLHLVGNYTRRRHESELYNFPAWPSTVPELSEAAGWTTTPSAPSRRQARVLKTANDWTTNLGHPGPANAAMGEIFDLLRPAEHDGPRRHRSADRRGIGGGGRAGDHGHLREVQGRGADGRRVASAASTVSRIEVARRA